MGRDITCPIVANGERFEGRALLETDEIVIRGEHRLKVPFKLIKSLDASDGRLHIVHADGEVTFELGEEAAKWAEKIRNPKSVLDKLGVKPGVRVAVIDVDDAGFLADLSARAEVVDAGDDLDMVFLGVEEAEHMAAMHALRDRIKRDGAVWVVYHKGRRDFNENDVLRLGLETGLVDVKVVRFSDTHTATKFVIRKADR